VALAVARRVLVGQFGEHRQYQRIGVGDEPDAQDFRSDHASCVTTRSVACAVVLVSMFMAAERPFGFGFGFGFGLLRR